MAHTGYPYNCHLSADASLCLKISLGRAYTVKHFLFLLSPVKWHTTNLSQKKKNLRLQKRTRKSCSCLDHPFFISPAIQYLFFTIQFFRNFQYVHCRNTYHWFPKTMYLIQCTPDLTQRCLPESTIGSSGLLLLLQKL